MLMKKRLEELTVKLICKKSPQGIFKRCCCKCWESGIICDFSSQILWEVGLMLWASRSVALILSKLEQTSGAKLSHLTLSLVTLYAFWLHLMFFTVASYSNHMTNEAVWKLCYNITQCTGLFWLEIKWYSVALHTCGLMWVLATDKRALLTHTSLI